MSHFLKHLLQLNGAGWQCDHTSSYVENPMPMACFYLFYPATGDVIHASMPIDNYMDLIGNHMKKLAPHLLRPEVLCGEVASFASNYYKECDKGLLPGLLGLYMASTRTGQSYFSQCMGKPFHFSVIMYPADKKGKQFDMRPFITMDNNPVLSIESLKGYCERVMDMDNQANKPFFKFLKHSKHYAKAG